MVTSAGTSSWSTTLASGVGLPLRRQLYESLRDSILQGRLRSGARLPSSRALQRELGVSRNTVLAALDELVAEGYLEGRPGSGMYVVARLPEELQIAQPDRPDPLVQPRLVAARTTVADELIGLQFRSTRRLQPFISWLPALDRFPVRTWLRLMKRRWSRLDPLLLSYSHSAGFRPLREAIAAHLSASRAVNCTADQVMITAGTQQGLSLVARVLLEDGARVVIEDPGYLGAVMAMRWAGAEVIHVPVDREGLDMEDTALLDGASLAYVTPSHQFPLGMTMSVSRRLALLDWARLTGAWILEDDYDSEYRFAGRPLASLQGMDAWGRVIYLGTFSKVLFPSLRLGYLVLPTALVGAFAAARAWSDWGSATLDQAVLADFIAEGHFGRHLRRMRALYAHRHAVLLEGARRHLAGLLDVQPGTGGMHTLGWLPDGVDAVAASRRAAEQGVVAIPLQDYAAGRTLRAGLILGFAGFDDSAIDNGLGRLALALARV